MRGLWDGPQALGASTFYLLFHPLSNLVPKAFFLWLSTLLSPTLSISLPPATLALPCHSISMVTILLPVSHPLSFCHPTTSIIFMTSSLPFTPSLCLMPLPYHHHPVFSPDTPLPLLPTPHPGSL